MLETVSETEVLLFLDFNEEKTCQIKHRDTREPICDRAARWLRESCRQDVLLCKFHYELYLLYVERYPEHECSHCGRVSTECWIHTPLEK